MPDPLEAVREAERLVREATERAEAMAREGARHIPPRGFDVPRREREEGAAAFPDLSALARLLELARSSLPPELSRQLAQALRELLIALRAVLDYSIERLEAAEPAAAPVEDIPIE
ncbi:MAG: hypothetical protein ACRDK0_03175 [Solirubrobacteraceae bacterium]